MERDSTGDRDTSEEAIAVIQARADSSPNSDRTDNIR